MRKTWKQMLAGVSAAVLVAASVPGDLTAFAAEELNQNGSEAVQEAPAEEDRTAEDAAGGQEGTDKEQSKETLPEEQLPEEAPEEGGTTPEETPAEEDTTSEEVPVDLAAEANGRLAILYTNDVHCAIDGYSKFAAYKADLEDQGYTVVTVDAGDAIQGEPIGALTEGEAIVDLMNAAGYDYAVPGNHEFDYGLDRFLELAESNAEYGYLSTNFVDLRNNATVFPDYALIENGNEQVALIGISTPETYTKSTPIYFQDENGNYIYSFSEDELYECIQDTVDDALANGADQVIAVGHMGIEGTTEGWKSTDVIANTTGIDAFIDAHSHETLVDKTVANKDGEAIPLTSTGTKFVNFGVMTFEEDGSVSAELVQTKDVNVNSSEAAKAAYDAVQAKIDGYHADMEYLNEKLGIAEVKLTISDEADEKKPRRIRSGETNMGDFVADAYRTVTGADISLVNGGGIRASIEAGDVTRKNIMDVNPWNNEMCVIRATGQQIIDALEHGARLYPEECGGFLQVSGISYEIHAYVESPVVTDEKGMFVKVDEAKQRRVQNVKVDGEPIDLHKSYTVAGSAYTLCNQGDGYTMFEGSEVVAKDGLPADAQMLEQYFTEHLKGQITKAQYGNLTGAGNIVVVKEAQKPGDGDNQDGSGQGNGDDTQKPGGGQKPNDNTKPSGDQNKKPDQKQNVATGDTTEPSLWIAILGLAAVAAVGSAAYKLSRRRK